MNVLSVFMDTITVHRKPQGRFEFLLFSYPKPAILFYFIFLSAPLCSFYICVKG